MSYKSISSLQLKELMKSETRPTLLDVREPNERLMSVIRGDIHIPMDEVPIRLSELDSTKPIVVYCRSGMRSATIAQLLDEQGFVDVSNLESGINGWAQTVDPSMSVY